jgi:hypothetical protein
MLVELITAVKESVSLIAAMAKLAEHAQHSEYGSVQDVLLRLKVDAVSMARGFQHEIDKLKNELSKQDIDMKASFREADGKISWLSLVKRSNLGNIERKLQLLSIAIKDLYSDTTSILSCSQNYEAVYAGVESAYDVRERVDTIRWRDTSIGDAIELLRSVNSELLKILGA